MRVTSSLVLRGVGLRGALLAVLAGCAPPRPPIEPIQVGVLNPLTGDLGSLGPSWEDAARLAAEQVNSAGGLFDGRPLELVFEDTKTNPAAAVAALQKLLDKDVVALVGPASSGEVDKTLPVIASAHKPQVSCCATAPALSSSQRDDQGFFFRTTPNDGLQGRALAYVATQGFAGDLTIAKCPEALVVHRADDYGVGLAGVFATAYAGVAMGALGTSRLLAPPIPYPTSQTDFTATTAAVLAALATHDPLAGPPVCVVVIAFAPDGTAAVSSLVAALDGYNNTVANGAFSYQLLATDGLYDNAFASAEPGAAAHVIGTAPTHAANGAYDQFDKAYTARFGLPPGNLTSNMYDAVLLTALALTASKSTDGPAIRDALFDVSRGGQVFEGRFFGDMAEAILKREDVDYVGPSGSLDFDASGDVVGDYVLWKPGLNGDNAQVIIEHDLLPAARFAP